VPRDEAESLTIPQLKQQLRLRGLKVSGRKSELVDRLLGRESSGPRDEMLEPEVIASETLLGATGGTG
jgi:hypothetical protein